MLKKYILTLLISMLPVVELRGAIPYGLAAGLPFWPVFICSFIGNLIPVPFIILFVRKIFEWIRTKSQKLDQIVSKLENKAVSKQHLIEKYRAWGLFVFVAIPLPGTGAWTGALIAAMFNIRLKTAFPIIALGVLTAGIIMSLITYGAAALFFI